MMNKTPEHVPSPDGNREELLSPVPRDNFPRRRRLSMVESDFSQSAPKDERDRRPIRPGKPEGY